MSEQECQPIIIGPYELRGSPLGLWLGGSEVRLQRQALKLLALLVSQPGVLVTHEAIRTRLWPNRHVDFARSTHVYINQIRAALGREGGRIKTVSGEGYRYLGPIVRQTENSAQRWGRSMWTLLGAIACISTVVLLWAREGNQTWQAAAAAEHLRLAQYESAERAARAALRRDTAGARAHVVLGRIAMTRDRDWTRADSHFELALSLDPDLAAAHQARAAVALLIGERAAASRHLARAFDLHPTSTLISANYAWIELVDGDARRSAELCRLALLHGLSPSRAHECLARALASDDRRREAVEHVLAAMNRQGASSFEILAVRAAEDPMSAFAEWRAGRMRAEGASPARIAVMYAWAGRSSEAVELLEAAYRGRDPALPLLLLDPAFDAVAHEERFRAMLERLAIARA